MHSKTAFHRKMFTVVISQMKILLSDLKRIKNILHSKTPIIKLFYRDIFTFFECFVPRFN